jgi:hypothetical protein
MSDILSVAGSDSTYILLLLVDMANLEPDVLLSERSRRVGNDVLEALPEPLEMRLAREWAEKLTSRDWAYFCCCL